MALCRISGHSLLGECIKVVLIYSCLHNNAAEEAGGVPFGRELTMLT